MLWLLLKKLIWHPMFTLWIVTHRIINTELWLSRTHYYLTLLVGVSNCWLWFCCNREGVDFLAGSKHVFKERHLSRGLNLRVNSPQSLSNIQVACLIQWFIPRLVEGKKQEETKKKNGLKFFKFLWNKQFFFF